MKRALLLVVGLSGCFGFDDRLEACRRHEGPCAPLEPDAGADGGGDGGLDDGGAGDGGEGDGGVCERPVVDAGACTDLVVDLGYSASLVAGVTGGLGDRDGAGPEARFSSSMALSPGARGELFLLDSDNARLKHVALSSGFAVETLVEGLPNFAQALAYDAVNARAVFALHDFNAPKIMAVPLHACGLELIAGADVSGTADGVGGRARFLQPSAVAVDGTTIYVADDGNCDVRKIVPSADGGVVTRISGTPGTCAMVDGRGTLGQYAAPSALVLSGDGGLYVADGELRQLSLSTFDLVTLTDAGLWLETLARSEDGALYASNGQEVFAVEPGTGAVTRLEGQDGGAIHSLAARGGRLYVAGEDGVLRERQVTDFHQTYAWGTAKSAGFRDGQISNPTPPLFAQPSGLARQGDVLYVADLANHRVRAIAQGQVSTVAGDGTNASADGRPGQLMSPIALALDARDGTLFIADPEAHAIRQLRDAGLTTVTTALGYPMALDFDGDRTLYVADWTAHVLRRVDVRTGAVSDVTDGGVPTPAGVALDGDGGAYVSLFRQGVVRVDLASGAVTPLLSSGGWNDGPASCASVREPRELQWREGKLYVADTGNSLVRVYDPVSHTVATVGGVRGQIGLSSSSPSPLSGVGGLLVVPFTQGKYLYVSSAAENAVLQFSKP